MKIANVQEMVFIDKFNKWFHASKFFQVVSHFYMWYQSYKTVIPQVILNFKWSSSEASSLTYKSSSISNGWPMLWHRGGAPPIGIKVKRSYMRYLKGYKWCHSNICGGVHKNARFKCQPSTPMQSFPSMRSTPFMEIDDKGGEIETKILQMGIWTWTMDKEGATLRNWEGSKFLDKRSTQAGGASSWTLISCIWYVHIHVLACIA